MFILDIDVLAKDILDKIELFIAYLQYCVFRGLLVEMLFIVIVLIYLFNSPNL